MTKKSGPPAIVEEASISTISPETILQSDSLKPVVEQIRNLILQAVETSDQVQVSSRKQLQKIVIALAQSLRIAMEYVELVDSYKEFKKPSQDPEPTQRQAARSVGDAGEMGWQKYKKYMTAKMIALNIVRVVFLSLDIALPLFSTAWLVFRFTGYTMADSLEHYAQDLNEPTARRCCVVV